MPLPQHAPALEPTSVRQRWASKSSMSPLLSVAALTLILLAPLFLYHAQRVQFDASVDVFFSADERSRGSFDKLEEMMTDRAAVLVLARREKLFSDEGALWIHELGAKLAELDGVTGVFSLTRAKRPVRAPGFSLDPSKLIQFEAYVPLESKSPAEWQAIEARVTDYPWAQDLLVSKDGRWTMLVAEVERDFADHEARVRMRADLETAVAPFRSQALELHVGGFPLIEAEVRDDVVRDMQRFFLVLPLLLVAVLLCTFRSWQVLLIILALETAGLGFLPVLVNWNGTTINLYTGILFPLVAGLQLTFLTHFCAAVKRALGHGLPFANALAMALHHVLRPSAIAGLTTVIGLLSLLACDVPLVRQFGELGAQAVVACFAVSFLPAWLLARILGASPSVAPMPALGAVTMPWFDGLLARLDRRRWLWITASVLLILAALPGWQRVKTDLRAIEFLSPKSAARQAMTAIDQNMGGMNLFELELDFGAPGAIQTAPALLYLEHLERHARQMEGVTNIYGYAQIYSMLNEIWSREQTDSRHVPTNPVTIAAMGLIVHSQQFVFGESIFDAEKQRTTLFLRTADMPAARYLALLEEFVAFAQSEAPPGVKVDARSGLHSVLESDRRIVGSQIRSLASCGLVVFLTLCLLWRSLRLALVNVFINLPPLAAVLAVHGYAGVPLNSVTVMVGAVVLGIAVDNGIHILTFWLAEKGSRRSTEILRAVLQQKLGAMVCTTAVLVGGLALFLLSSFPPVADFGALAMLSLSTALASTVLLLPPLVGVLFALNEPACAAVAAPKSATP